MKYCIIFFLLTMSIVADDMWKKGTAIENKEEALKYYMKISEKFEDKPKICAKAYEQMALCHIDLGQKLQAADCYSYANSLLDSTNEMRKERQVWTSNAAIYYENLQKWELAAESYLQAASLTDFPSFANKYIINAAKTYQKIGYFSEAIDTYKLALERPIAEVEKIKMTQLLWQCKLEMAAQYEAEKNYGEAAQLYETYGLLDIEAIHEKYLHKALAMYKKLHNLSKEAKIYTALAHIAQKNRENNDAFAFSEAAFYAASLNVTSVNSLEEIQLHFSDLQSYAHNFIAIAEKLHKKHIAKQKIAASITKTISLYKDLNKNISGQNTGKVALDLAKEKQLIIE